MGRIRFHGTIQDLTVPPSSRRTWSLLERKSRSFCRWSRTEGVPVDPRLSPLSWYYNPIAGPHCPRCFGHSTQNLSQWGTRNPVEIHADPLRSSPFTIDKTVIPTHLGLVTHLSFILCTRVYGAFDRVPNTHYKYLLCRSYFGSRFPVQSFTTTEITVTTLNSVSPTLSSGYHMRVLTVTNPLPIVYATSTEGFT